MYHDYIWDLVTTTRAGTIIFPFLVFALYPQITQLHFFLVSALYPKIIQMKEIQLYNYISHNFTSTANCCFIHFHFITALFLGITIDNEICHSIYLDYIPISNRLPFANPKHKTSSQKSSVPPISLPIMSMDPIQSLKLPT